MPLMKRKELAVATSDTAMMDQRAPAPSSPAPAVRVCIPHARIGTGNRW